VDKTENDNNLMPLAQRRIATVFVLFTVFIYSMGFGIIMPVLPDLIMELESISLPEATLIGGYLAASYALMQFLLGPLIGNLSDKFGRRPVFLLSLLGFGIDYALMGFAPNIIWLFVGRMIAGGLGAIFGPANSAMADMSSGEDRAKGFGLVGAAFGIGFIVGPALGGILSEFGTRIPFFVASGLALVNFLFGLFTFPETLAADKRRTFLLRRANPIGALANLSKFPTILGISLAYVLWMMGTSIYPSTWAYYAPAQFGWDSQTVGYSLTIVGISMAFVQAVLLGRFVSRFGERKTAIIGIAAAAVFFLCYTFTTNGITALIVCAFVGIQGMVMPSLNAMMSRRVPADMQGELQGFNGSMAALATMAAPIIYNSTLFYFTAEERTNRFAGAPFAIAAVMAFITLFIVWRLKPAAEVRAELKS